MEYHMFLEEFRKSPGSIWIMKPVAKSQGKGIFLFRRIKDIEAWKRSGTFNPSKVENSANGEILVKEGPEHYVVSKYIANPYLIGGRKFDLRVYVLVLSFQPLKAWVFRDGFARLSNTGFSLDSIDDQYVHLTNVAIQKTAPDYDAERGLKWSVCRLRRFLVSKHGSEKIDKLFRDIDTIFVSSLLSVQKIMINDKHCFELYGYDILLDENLKPWLLEINSSPSLSASSDEDRILKMKMLDDVLSVVDMERRLTGKEKRVGDFDLIWDDGPVQPAGSPSQVWLTEVLASLQSASTIFSTSGSTHGSLTIKNQPVPTTNNMFTTSTCTNQKSETPLSALILSSSLNSYLGCLPCQRSIEMTRKEAKQRFSEQNACTDPIDDVNHTDYNKKCEDLCVDSI